MPFRSAHALVTVEREGVLASYVTEISGKDPVIEVKMPGSYAPDVYVSVLAVRGRVAGFSSLLSHHAYKWGPPFGSPLATQPPAPVDLANPPHSPPIANVMVGSAAQRPTTPAQTVPPHHPAH